MVDIKGTELKPTDSGTTYAQVGDDALADATAVVAAIPVGGRRCRPRRRPRPRWTWSLLPHLALGTGVVVAAVAGAMSSRGHFGTCSEKIEADTLTAAASGVNVFETRLGAASLPFARVAEVYRYFDVEHQYDAMGNVPPVVVRSCGEALPAMETWGRPGYLATRFGAASRIPTFLSTAPAPPAFVRGTSWMDAPMNDGNGTSIELLQDADPAIVFGDRAAGSSLRPDGAQHHAAAVVGLVDIAGKAELLGDLSPLPPFMTRGAVPSMGEHGARIWGNNGDVDTGLHYDENHGGFMLQVVGRKDVVLFPNKDENHLYMRSQHGAHKAESSLFISKSTDLDRETHPLLWETTPFVATLLPGDALYIPHRWFHEVYSHGRSVGVSVWVQAAGPPIGGS